jgi:hypothetical protein
MLWMKAWLETRWRFCFMLGFAVLTIVMGEQGGGLRSAENAHNLMFLQLMLSILAANYLAGAGIRTQSPFRVKAGLHGSTSFTLSMPASRFRLLAVRGAFGFLETAGIVTFMIVCAWSLFPLVRGTSTFVDLLKLTLAVPACLSCFYFLSVTAATVLDEMWQVYGGYLIAGLAWWATVRLRLPSSANVFQFMTDASPLITHRLPWPAMAISLLASAVLFIAALKIVQTHES